MLLGVLERHGLVRQNGLAKHAQCAVDGAQDRHERQKSQRSLIDWQYIKAHDDVMGCLKSYALLSLLLCVAALPPARLKAEVFPTSPSQRADLFATCAGRSLAVIEHLSLFGGNLVDRAEQRRVAFRDMLEAITPYALADGAQPLHLLSLRVQARADMRMLLSSARFAAPDANRTSLRQAADRQIAACDALLLGA